MRTVPFGDVLDFVSMKLHGLPSTQIMREEAAALVTFINDAVRNVWEREFWPELMQIEERYYRDQWDGAVDYAEGDEVYLLDADGDPVYYRALRATTNDSPDVSTDDWEEATDLLKYVPIGDDEPLAAGAGTPSAVGPASLDRMVLSVAQLTALEGIDEGAFRFVFDATYGFGTYEFKLGSQTTSAPTYYRADDDAGYWENVL